MYFAYENTRGDLGQGTVFAFQNKKFRDKFVSEYSDAYDEASNTLITCIAIRKREVTKYATYYSNYHGRYIKPRPFYSEAWYVGKGADAMFADELPEGATGIVYVGSTYATYESGKRLYR